MKWWWRPVYTLSLGQITEWSCPFCPAHYEGAVQHDCSCGAVRVLPYGMCGQVPKDYDRLEMWC